MVTHALSSSTRTIDGGITVPSLLSSSNLTDCVAEITLRSQLPLQDRKTPTPRRIFTPISHLNYHQRPPNTNAACYPPPSHVAWNNLDYTISLASKKVFGSKVRRGRLLRVNAARPRGHERPLIITLEGDGAGFIGRQSLAVLEELAQKPGALTYWAGEMYEYTTAVPQSESTVWGSTRLHSNQPG